MKNKDINELLQAISLIADVKATAKFNYAICKAKNDLESEVKAISETIETIQKEYSEEEKQVITKLHNQEIQEDEIQEDIYNSIIEKNKRINDFVNSTYEGKEIYKIKLAYVPDNLELKVFNKLMLIIIDEEV